MTESKVLEGFEKYLVYNDGRIWSFSKRCWMKPSLSTDGYPSSVFINARSVNGYRNTMKIHRIIAMAFVPNPNNYQEVNHIDGNKLNNHYTNLEWCTRSENLSHCYKLGLRNSDGSRKASSTLKEWQVKAIRFFYEFYGYTQNQLAELYGVKQASISGIVLRKSWKHI